MELREQLQSLLGGTYQIDSELGGGGMSRVFSATETALGRKVVIKVLPAELGAGVNVERFKREIQLAANLQHPHVVPVLTAGEMGGVPFYTMPFIDGQSLRARLANGPLPIDQCVSLLRDVARALAYAHERGVVHRDIKPDNVLISGASATVTDFGIAKAITAARAGDTLGGAAPGALTQMGMSIGTPTYMAPEQAAADPATDYRADIYSFGCMAYEMLAGRPPFSGLAPQKLLAAHMGARPQPVSELRPDTPPALADLVMLCLEKDPDARPQSAADVARVLDAVSTGATAALASASRPRSVGEAALLYAAASAAAILLAKAAEVAFGVPSWVMSTTIGIVIVGVPLFLATAFVQRVSRRAATPTPRTGATPAPTTLSTVALRASPYLSWRHVTRFMVSTIGSFALLVIALMALRPLGIGPLKSLMASGQLHERDKIIVGDFTSTGADTTLGGVIAEAVRADLGQSMVISVVTPQQIAADLQLMQKAPNARVDTAVARAIARREGAKGIVTGDVHSVASGGFVVTMRLVGADSGQELAALSGSADGTKDLIPTIGKLTRSLRRQMGESLKHVQASAQLAQVTTGSLPALEAYSEGRYQMLVKGDLSEAIKLFRKAVTLDTSFAMAYRALAVALGNRNQDRDERLRAMEKALAHVDRLTEPEKYLTIATYYTQGPKPDDAKAIAAYDTLLSIDPNNFAALNNVALLYARKRDFAKAEQSVRRSVAANPTSLTGYTNLMTYQSELGQLAAMESTWAASVKASNNLPRVVASHAPVLYARGQYDSAAALMDSLARVNPDLKQSALGINGAIALTRGRVNEGLRLWGQSAAMSTQFGSPIAGLNSTLDSALVEATLLDSRQTALKRVEGGLSRTPLSSIQALSRPYASLAQVYAIVGRPDLAREMLSEFERNSEGFAPDVVEASRHQIAGVIALSERRYMDAVREARLGDVGTCTICMLPIIAAAYDGAQQPDSAIAVFTRYVESTAISNRVGSNEYFLAGAYKRLGELLEAKGDRSKAAHYYAKFVDLWKNADPQLQPQVADVRKRLARLSDVEAR